jgi:BrnA antitoxin of type II toxin-antitoxin system
MKEQYDFSKGKRGPVVNVGEGKEKITIRLDREIVDWFRNVVDKAGGGNYQTLGEYIEGKTPKFEDTLRRIIREELAAKLNAA